MCLLPFFVLSGFLSFNCDVALPTSLQCLLISGLYKNLAHIAATIAAILHTNPSTWSITPRLGHCLARATMQVPEGSPSTAEMWTDSAASTPSDSVLRADELPGHLGQLGRPPTGQGLSAATPNETPLR